MHYKSYYHNYIGYKGSNNLISNKKLEVPINNNYLYLAIITFINKKRIVSINNTFYNIILSKYRKCTNIKLLKNFFSKHYKNIIVRKMYRLTSNKKSYFFNYNEIVFNESKLKCVILNNDKIVSYAKISNIDFNGANIVIFTEKKYRNKGYGTKVLSYITNYCLNNNLIPILLIDKENKPSIKIAKNVGYKIMNKEIIISTNLKEL